MADGAMWIRNPAGDCFPGARQRVEAGSCYFLINRPSNNWTCALESVVPSKTLVALEAARKYGQ